MEKQTRSHVQVLLLFFAVFLFTILSSQEALAQAGCCVFSAEPTFCSWESSQEECVSAVLEQSLEEFYFDEHILEQECTLLCSRNDTYISTLLQSVPLESASEAKGSPTPEESGQQRSPVFFISFVVVFIFFLGSFVVFSLWQKEKRLRQRFSNTPSRSEKEHSSLPSWLSPATFSNEKEAELQRMREAHARKVKEHQRREFLKEHHLEPQQRKSDAFHKLEALTRVQNSSKSAAGESALKERPPKNRT